MTKIYAGRKKPFNALIFFTRIKGNLLHILSRIIRNSLSIWLYSIFLEFINLFAWLFWFDLQFCLFSLIITGYICFCCSVVEFWNPIFKHFSFSWVNFPFSSNNFRKRLDLWGFFNPFHFNTATNVFVRRFSFPNCFGFFLQHNELFPEINFVLTL